MLPRITGSAVKTNSPCGVETSNVTMGSSVMSFTISNEMSSMAHMQIWWANDPVVSNGVSRASFSPHTHVRLQDGV